MLPPSESPPDKFSSPVPMVGLYITIATQVCLVFMLYDLYYGFWFNKSWIPCRLFSLNSLTLTLLSIATKIPSDLTTPMPDLLDQSSKRIGILLLWTCMKFFIPSLGGMTPFQTLSNLTALSILVVTVVADIWIQIDTGVTLPDLYIFVILFSLLLTLADLWISALEINNEKNIVSDRNTQHLRNGNGTMLHRLRSCYINSYISNPQLLLCMNQFDFFLGFSSLLFTLFCFNSPSNIISSKHLRGEYGYGWSKSDYKWSIEVVVISQITTIWVGNFINIFRCLMFFNKTYLCSTINFLMTKVEVLEVMHTIPNKNTYQCLLYVGNKVLVLFLTIRLQMTVWMIQGKATFRKYLNYCDEMDDDSISAYQNKVEKWMARKGEEDVEQWIGFCKRDPLNYLIIFLLEALPSVGLLSHYIQITAHENNWDEIGDDYKLSCLSAVILVRMASDSLSVELSHSLVHALDEAFPIIMFIEKNTSEDTFENERKYIFAEKMWKCWDFKSRLNVGEDIYSVQSIPFVPLVTSQRESYFNSINKEFGLLKKLVDFQSSSSEQVPYKAFQQLLVHMLHEILAKFPIAVFRYVTGASPYESEDRIKLSINFICKLEPLVNIIQWNFPCETNIISLTSASVNANDGHDNNEFVASDIVNPTAIHTICVNEKV